MSDTRPDYPLVCEEGGRGQFCEQDVHEWFGLTYASYLVLPRSLMQEMPAAWQHEMVMLLERMHEEFPEAESDYMVQLRGPDRRFKQDPLRNYRYPTPMAIERARGEAP